jgi:hypothetical protein
MAFQIPENAKISVTSSFPIKQLILKDFNRVKRVGFTPVTQVANAKKKKKKKKQFMFQPNEATMLTGKFVQ